MNAALKYDRSYSDLAMEKYLENQPSFSKDLDLRAKKNFPKFRLFVKHLGLSLIQWKGFFLYIVFA